jgi:hypothetical protein
MIEMTVTKEMSDFLDQCWEEMFLMVSRPKSVELQVSFSVGAGSVLFCNSGSGWELAAHSHFLTKDDIISEITTRMSE